MVHEIAKANTGHEPIQLNVRQYNFLKYKNTREFHTTTDSLNRITDIPTKPSYVYFSLL